jgi:hypothetical protein
MNINVVVIKTFNKYPSQTKNTSKMLLELINLTIYSHMWLSEHQQTFLLINQNFKKNKC